MAEFDFYDDIEVKLPAFNVDEQLSSSSKVRGNSPRVKPAMAPLPLAPTPSTISDTDPHADQPEEEGPVMLMVEGLTWYTSDAALERVFRPFGNIRMLRIYEDGTSCKSRGVAVVHYYRHSDAVNAQCTLHDRVHEGEGIAFKVTFVTDAEEFKSYNGMGPPPRVPLIAQRMREEAMTKTGHGMGGDYPPNTTWFHAHPVAPDRPWKRQGRPQQRGGGAEKAPPPRSPSPEREAAPESAKPAPTAPAKPAPLQAPEGPPGAASVDAPPAAAASASSPAVAPSASPSAAAPSAAPSPAAASAPPSAGTASASPSGPEADAPPLAGKAHVPPARYGQGGAASAPGVVGYGPMAGVPGLRGQVPQGYHRPGFSYYAFHQQQSQHPYLQPPPGQYQAPGMPTPVMMVNQWGEVQQCYRPADGIAPAYAPPTAPVYAPALRQGPNFLASPAPALEPSGRLFPRRQEDDAQGAMGDDLDLDDFLVPTTDLPASGGRSRRDEPKSKGGKRHRDADDRPRKRHRTRPTESDSSSDEGSPSEDDVIRLVGAADVKSEHAGQRRDKGKDKERARHRDREKDKKKEKEKEKEAHRDRTREKAREGEREKEKEREREREKAKEKERGREKEKEKEKDRERRQKSQKEVKKEAVNEAAQGADQGRLKGKERERGKGEDRLAAKGRAKPRSPSPDGLRHRLVGLSRKAQIREWVKSEDADCAHIILTGIGEAVVCKTEDGDPAGRLGGRHGKARDSIREPRPGRAQRHVALVKEEPRGAEGGGTPKKRRKSPERSGTGSKALSVARTSKIKLEEGSEWVVVGRDD